MTPPQRFGFAAIKAAAQKAVDESSLRAVADQIPMSFRGLKDLLDGTTVRPHPATMEKLARWYASRRGQGTEPSRADVEAAVAILRTFIEGAPNTVTAKKRRREILERLE